MRSMIRFSLTAVVLLLLALPVWAERDLTKEQKIWEELQSTAPSVVPTFKAATEAMDKNDWPEAAKLYEMVLKKAPNTDAVYRRLGGVYIEMGKRQEGLVLLEKAVEKKPSTANLLSLAQGLLTASNKRDITHANKERAFVMAHRASLIEKNEAALSLLAGLSLELNRTRDFQEAHRDLQQNFPDSMQTHYFNAIQAIETGDTSTATLEINRAEQLGLNPQFAAELRDSYSGSVLMWRVLYAGLILVGLWVCGLLALFLTGKWMSAQMLRSVAASDPNATINPAEQHLRNRYKQLIRAASIYYYVSLPIVILLVLGFAAGVLQFFFLLGQIPVKLVLMLALGALITVFITIKSLFTRIIFEAPGRALGREEAPGLWNLAEQVAAQVGTRAIDEIRITPGTDFAVYEAGSPREIKQDRGQRVLLLGIGTLNGFNQQAFRAVLAHEYGHFSHRDTAGGEDALRVNARMAAMAQAMIASEQNTPWNIAFHFLRLYYFLFRRLSHGATRLQEILADRVAVQNYGAAAFKAGLSHAIRRSLEFDLLTSKEINAAVHTQRALVNLYQLEVATTDTEKLIEEQYLEVINRPTTEDDTHPSPCERFALAEKIITAPVPEIGGQVWDLFTNQAELTEEMSRWVENNITVVEAA